MIERKYKIRPSWKGQKGEKGKEITLHPDWCKYNKMKTVETKKKAVNRVRLKVTSPPKIVGHNKMSEFNGPLVAPSTLSQFHPKLLIRMAFAAI